MSVSKRLYGTRPGYAGRVDELLELEHAGWKALCDGTASAFYGDLMTEDGVMVLADGSVMTRDDVVTALAEAPPWSSYDIDDPRCVPLGDAAAALVYTGTGRRDGSDDFVGVMTSVYARRDGRWALALYQQTPKP